MAKSTLEIVLQDEGQIAPVAGPSVATATAASAAPVVSASTASPTSTAAAATQPAAPPTPTQEASEPASRADTTTAELATRIAQATVRAVGLQQVVGSIGQWSGIFQDLVSALNRSVATTATQMPAQPQVTSAPASIQPAASTVTAPAATAAAPEATAAAEPLSGVAAWTSASRGASVAAATAAPVAATATTAATTAGPATAATAAPAASGAASAAPLATALGPIGVAALAVTAAFAATVIATKALYSALSSAVEGVAAYSEATAAATAETEMRQERAAFARAQQIGPQMADFERTRGRFQERFANMGTEVLKILLSMWETIEPAAEKGLSVMEAMVAIASVIEKALEIQFDTMTGQIDELVKDTKEIGPLLSKSAKELGEIFKGEEEDPLENHFLDDLMGLGTEMAIRGPGGGGGAPRRARRGGP